MLKLFWEGNEANESLGNRCGLRCGNQLFTNDDEKEWLLGAVSIVRWN
jgi:hypothetical protein